MRKRRKHNWWIHVSHQYDARILPQTEAYQKCSIISFTMIFLHRYYTSDTVAVLTKNTFADESSNSVGHRINITLNLTENRYQ